MTRKDPREAFNELVRKRQPTPVPGDVEERLRARLHAFREDLELRDAHPLLPRKPRFGHPADGSRAFRNVLAILALVVCLGLAVATLSGLI